MYLSGVAILAGVALLMGSPTPALIPLLFAVLALGWYIRPEEALLERELKGEYAAYRSRVRRWI